MAGSCQAPRIMTWSGLIVRPSPNARDGRHRWGRGPNRQKVERLAALAATLFDFPEKRLAAFLANSARRAGLVSVLSMTGTKQMVLQNTGTTRNRMVHTNRSDDHE
jgi:hypothetical protein